MRGFILLFATLSLGSCKNKNRINNEPKKISIIEGYPKGFSGCGCAFSKSKEAYRDQKFIYLEKYGMVNEEDNFKIISINGNLIKWTKNKPSKDFVLKIDSMQSEKKDHEYISKKGKLILEFDDGTILHQDFVGHCGC